MMQRIKRPVSILLAILMVAGLFAIVPVTAGAKSYEEGVLVRASELQVGDTIGTNINDFLHEDYTFILKGGSYGTGYVDFDEDEYEIWDVFGEDLTLSYESEMPMLDYSADCAITDVNNEEDYYPVNERREYSGKWYVLAVNGETITLGGFMLSDNPGSESSSNISMSVGKYFRMGYYKGLDVDWYCAKNNSTGYFMYCKYALKSGRFGANATYKTSDIHKWLDIDSGGTFANDLGLTDAELSVVRTVNLSSTGGDGTDSFIIPAYANNEMTSGSAYKKAGLIDEETYIPHSVWLRTARDASNARVIRQDADATVAARYRAATNNNKDHVIRPMFYLDNNAFKKLVLSGTGTENDPYVIKARACGEDASYCNLEDFSAGNYLVKGIKMINVGIGDSADYTVVVKGGTYGKVVDDKFEICTEDLVSTEAYIDTDFNSGEFIIYDYNTHDEYYPVVDGQKADSFVIRSLNHNTKTITIAGRNIPAPPAYSVTWKDWDGKVLETDRKVYVNTIPTYDGTTPTRAEDNMYSYEFRGWDPQVTAVTGNTVYTAVYNGTMKLTEKKATLDLTKNVDYNSYWYSTAEPFSTSRFSVIPYEDDDNQVGADEDGWTLDGDYPDKSYVTISALNGETISKVVIHRSYYDNYPALTANGKNVPFVEDVETFTFDTLNTSQVKIHSAGDDIYMTIDTIDVYYIGGPAGYNVTWNDEDGSTLEFDEDVIEGKLPTFDGETPSKESTDEYDYTFAGWTPEVSTITDDVTYTATYNSKKRSYTVTWMNEDGSVIDTTTVEYGEMPAHADPEKANTAQYSYPFLGWSPAITAVTSDAEYTAQFGSTVNEYTVTWKNGDDVLKTEKVAYGETPAYNDETPTKASDAEYDYAFTGWTPEVKAVTGDVTYTAVYSASARNYTVTWKNGDEVIKTDTVAYGTVPAYDGADPVKADDDKYTYTFSGWTPEITAVTGDAEYTATFDAASKAKNGPQADGYFYLNDVRQNAYQLIKFEDNYYFINDAHKYAKSMRLYMSERFVKDHGLAVGYYDFDADGKMIIVEEPVKNGPQADGYFYIDNVRQNSYQLVKYEGDYYFINDGHKIAKNVKLYLRDSFVAGTDLAPGYYDFDADGKVIFKNGPADDGYFYLNGARQNAYQLIKFEDNYYFINDAHKYAKSMRLYLSERFVKDHGLAVGYYDFDADGKMIIVEKPVKNGPQADGYFYIDNVRQNSYQLVKYEGDYYFINDGHKIAKNVKLYLRDSFVAGTDLAPGYYAFDADGKVIFKDGPADDGYFYLNGARQNAYQLIKFEDNYYFINDAHKYAKSMRLYLSERFVKDHGLAVGYYDFDATGKMVVNE